MGIGLKKFSLTKLQMSDSRAQSVLLSSPAFLSFSGELFSYLPRRAQYFEKLKQAYHLLHACLGEHSSHGPSADLLSLAEKRCPWSASSRRSSKRFHFKLRKESVTQGIAPEVAHDGLLFQVIVIHMVKIPEVPQVRAEDNQVIMIKYLNGISRHPGSVTGNVRTISYSGWSAENCFRYQASRL